MKNHLPFVKTVSWVLFGTGFFVASNESAAESGVLTRVVENSLGMKFVLVPAGEFRMGNDASPDSLAQTFPQYDVERFAKLGDESPSHKVAISKPFFLGQHEVTVGQFRKFLELSGYRPEAEADGTGGYGFNPDYDPATSRRRDAFEGRDPRYSWRNPGFAQTDEHPVLNVTWNDAVAMVNWLSEREGIRYRLPAEAEWEYACRAGSQTHFHNGNSPENLHLIANTFDQMTASHWPQWSGYASNPDGYTFTAPVGRLAPNAFGLHDMLGNAWEWVADWYGEHYYQTSPAIDPPGPSTGQVRVRRGGSWHTWPLYARCSFRNWNTPQTRYTLVGMRLLREADPAD